eukprot:5450823-Pyramimonas_sp.AAC.1
MICGMTTSQVSMDTCWKPSSSARSTSAAAPWLNHSVSSRRMSCRHPPRRLLVPSSAMEEKKPCTAGDTWRIACAGEVLA